MSYGTVVMRLLIFILFISVFLGTNCDVSYVPKITDRVLSCNRYENKFLDCQGLKLGSSTGNLGDESAKLSGLIKTLKIINSDYDIEVDIWKMLAIGDEYMYSTRVNFCSSLKNTDAPWYPAIEKLNISGCPVPISIFEVQGLTISLEAFKGFMCHDFCGAYRVQISFVHVTEKISCHVIELSIVELEDDEDDEK